MWSIGGLVLLEVAACVVLLAVALHRVANEIGPTRESFELVRVDVERMVRLAARDTGRAAAGRRVLARPGTDEASR